MNEKLSMNTYTQLTTNIKTLICNLMVQNIKLSLKITEKAKEEREKIPFQINVIKSAARGRLKETAHSRILVDLLRNEKIRESFIHYFFRQFNLSTCGKYSIPAPDTNRIDVTIEKKGEFYIIIENKVNEAEEQRGQIYRYYQTAKNEGYNNTNIYVLYLNARTSDLPSSFSLTKEGTGEDSVKPLLGDHLICCSYKYDIIKWLKTLVENNNLESEPYLQSALNQYIDYLEIYFEISHKYDAMNKEIEQLLINELKLDTLENNIEKVDAINNTLGNISFLKDKLETLEKKYIDDIWLEWEKDYTNKYNKIKINNKGKNLGFYFQWNNIKMRCCITKEEKLFWGIRQCDKKANKDTIEYFKSLIEETNLTLGKGSENIWPIWNYTSYRNGLQRLETLTKVIIEQSKIDPNLIISE